MNAVLTDQPAPEADRTARHLRMLQEMAEVCMNLARLAAEKAATQLTAAETATEEAADRRKASNPSVDVARFYRLALQAITVEARLAAGPKSAKTAAPISEAVRSDTRRGPLRRGLHIATEFHSDRKALRRQVEKSLDNKLGEDPGHEQAIANLFMAICEDIGIKPDLGKIPDECLGFNIPSPAEDEEPQAPALDVHSEEFLSYLRTGRPIPDFAKGGWIK